MAVGQTAKPFSRNLIRVQAIMVPRRPHHYSCLVSYRCSVRVAVIPLLCLYHATISSKKTGHALGYRHIRQLLWTSTYAYPTTFLRLLFPVEHGRAVSLLAS